MALVPYSTDKEKWIKHFSNSHKSTMKKGLYLLSNQVQRGGGEIEIISPTAQTVERANAVLNKGKRKPTSKKTTIKKRKKSKPKQSCSKSRAVKKRQGKKYQKRKN